jgi:RNA 2',3'-cyclic 3'-phosphodiesterase
VRLFVALDLPPAIKDELSRVIETLRDAVPNARWVPRANLHLTVKFIGHIPDERLAAISAAVGEATSTFVDFTTHLEGLGAFPSAKRARVLWVGLADPAGGLAAIAGSLDEALEPLAIPREKRAFTPHLTLARLRVPASVAHVPDVPLDSTPFPVDRITLFESRLRRPAPVYEPLAIFPFRGH